MRILSHRGFWSEPAEKNTMLAFRRSFELGFGTETDIRDHAGRLVISHDMPNGSEPGLEEVLALMRETGCNGPLAVNIKADGLQAEVARILATHADIDYFVFDMSLPDTLGYARQKSPFYLRLSEYETDLPPIESCAGIWLDAFVSRWYDAPRLATLLELHPVCIVSDELHRRPHLPHWEFLKSSGLAAHPSLSLCTDHPVQAREFFDAS